MLATADVVTIQLVLSERTRGLIGERELRLMKPGAFLVNTSRGPIVQEPALVQALRERRIAGAGLDVFDVEPLPREHPLRTLDSRYELSPAPAGVRLEYEGRLAPRSAWLGRIEQYALRQAIVAEFEALADRIEHEAAAGRQ